jgi:hypothetical protein
MYGLPRFQRLAAVPEGNARTCVETLDPHHGDLTIYGNARSQVGLVDGIGSGLYDAVRVCVLLPGNRGKGAHV